MEHANPYHPENPVRQYNDISMTEQADNEKRMVIFGVLIVFSNTNRKDISFSVINQNNTDPSLFPKQNSKKIHYLSK